MADRLASIIGTEKDKVNCPFYLKIGCCRHGDRCSRIHIRPTFSQTLLIPRMYPNPKANPQMTPEGEIIPYDRGFLRTHFDNFYEDVFTELSNYGELEVLEVCDNVCEHMLGSVFAKFRSENDAMKAMEGMHGRFYAGVPLQPEYSPVTDFREARCRQYEQSECNREGFCNFMHLLEPDRELRRSLFREQRKRYGRRSASPSRSRSRRLVCGARHSLWWFG